VGVRHEVTVRRTELSTRAHARVNRAFDAVEGILRD
jgi:hypothetical protein